MIAKGSKIQSGPGHRFAPVPGSPFTGTVVRVVDDGKVEVKWDRTTFEDRPKVLANSVESVDDLELVEAPAAKPRRTTVSTRATHDRTPAELMQSKNPTSAAIEESLTFAVEHGLIRLWKRLPVQGAAGKWEVMVHPSAHAAEPADVCVLRTYTEAKLFVAALMSARTGLMSTTTPATATARPRRTVAGTRPTGGPKIPAALVKMSHDRMRRWANANAERDDVILSAYGSGVGVNEITRSMGIAKTTVLRVLHPEGDQ